MSTKFLTQASLQAAVDAATAAAVTALLPSIPSPDGLWRPRDNGFVAASSDPAIAQASQTAMVSGTQYISKLKMDAASACAGVRFYCTTAATALTEATCDLFDSTGARIATADIKTALQTAAIANVSFTSATATRTLGEALYVGLRCTFASGTAPIVRGLGTATIPNANVTGASTRYGTAGTGITSAQTSITPASISPSSVGAQCHWVGLT